MIFLIGAILVIATVIFVGYPLLRPKKVSEQENDEHQELLAKRSALNLLIEELELDFEMGNISEEEYRRLDRKYREALGSLFEVARKPLTGHSAEDETKK